MRLCIIPARGGSKRIPRKNIKEFCGKPLISYSIKVAQKSKLFDKIVVSTDDEEIAQVAIKYGAEVLQRPKELADDFCSSGEAVNHAIKCLKNQKIYPNYVCTLYATAPMLQVEYLIEGFNQIKNNDAWQAFSVTSFEYPIQRAFEITTNNRCKMFTPHYFPYRSQDLVPAFHDAGQFYWQNLDKTPKDIPFGDDSIPIIVPRYLVQDIDTEEDWIRAELMYKSFINLEKNAHE